jgi:hypothetical protein
MAVEMAGTPLPRSLLVAVAAHRLLEVMELHLHQEVVVLARPHQFLAAASLMLAAVAEFLRMVEPLVQEVRVAVVRAFLAQREPLEPLILVAGAVQEQMLVRADMPLAAQAVPASSFSNI